MNELQRKLAAVLAAEHALNQDKKDHYGPFSRGEKNGAREAIENIVGSMGDVFAAIEPFNRNEWYIACLGRSTLRREVEDNPRTWAFVCKSCREAFDTPSALLDHDCQGPAVHPGQQVIETDMSEEALQRIRDVLVPASEITARKIGAKASAEPMFKYAGTISHGTLRSEDLIRAFMPVLADLDRAALQKIILDDRLANENDLAEIMNETVAEMVDALNDAAPEGYYFGAIEGDGSDFGFWLNDDEGGE